MAERKINTLNQKSKENKLLITVQNKIKLFYRPKTLSRDEAIDAYKNSFLIERKDLRGKNPSPFYVSFYSVSIDGKEVKEVDMIAPQSTKNGYCHRKLMVKK